MNSRYFCSVMVTGLILSFPTACFADEVKELEARVAALETRLASLEESLKPVLTEVKAKQLRSQQQTLARERMREDHENYSRLERQEIETLYQVANKNWRTQEAQQSLLKLIKKYDKANRTGCAILYLGQMSKGSEKIEYLNKAIEHGDCYYGDGVQVGAYARFLLAHTYAQDGQTEKAKKLFDELRNNYPDAIDHKGNLLVNSMPKL